MLSEQEQEALKVLHERKQADLARLTDNLSDEKKVARRQRAAQAVETEEQSIAQQIPKVEAAIQKVEAEIQESIDG